VCSLFTGHPKVVKAIQEQAAQLIMPGQNMFPASKPMVSQGAGGPMRLWVSGRDCIRPDAGVRCLRCRKKELQAAQASSQPQPGRGSTDRPNAWPSCVRSRQSHYLTSNHLLMFAAQPLPALGCPCGGPVLWPRVELRNQPEHFQTDFCHLDHSLLCASIEPACACPALWPQVELLQRFERIMPSHLTRFLFCNSGAEAVENAVKIARSYTGRQNIIAFEVR
jgi:hypothetical protein